MIKIKYVALMEFAKLLKKFIENKIDARQFCNYYISLWKNTRNVPLFHVYRRLIDNLFTDCDMFSVDPKLYGTLQVSEEGLKKKSIEVLHYLLVFEPSLKSVVRDVYQIRLEKYDVKSLEKRLLTNAMFVKIIKKRNKIIYFAIRIDKENKKYVLEIEEFLLDFILKNKLPKFKKIDFPTIEEIIIYLDKKSYLKRTEWIKDD